MRVLLALAGLFTCTTLAHAECAWILWEFKERYYQKSGALDAAWTILRVYDSSQECRTDQAKLLSGDTSWAPAYKNRSRLDDGFFVSIEVDGKVVGTIKQRALCVPDTVDPRGPKGK